jgi:nitrite reductase/ring-hydroxylating ferredoxin subunit
MRRSEGLHVVSRRAFCGSAAACLGVALVNGCLDGDSTNVVATGSLDGPDGSHGSGSGSGSGSGHPPPDAGVGNVDSGTAATCPSSGVTDVGAASTFTNNNPVYFSSGNFFVVRDSGGLYALTARCTHQGVTVEVNSGEFFCPAHGATFDFNGTVTGSPAFTNLVHYEMCTLANGHVGVVKSQTVSQSQRLVA